MGTLVHGYTGPWSMGAPVHGRWVHRSMVVWYTTHPSIIWYTTHPSFGTPPIHPSIGSPVDLLNWVTRRPPQLGHPWVINGYPWVINGYPWVINGYPFLYFFETKPARKPAVLGRKSSSFDEKITKITPFSAQKTDYFPVHGRFVGVSGVRKRVISDILTSAI